MNNNILKLPKIENANSLEKKTVKGSFLQLVVVHESIVRLNASFLLFHLAFLSLRAVDLSL